MQPPPDEYHWQLSSFVSGTNFIYGKEGYEDQHSYYWWL